VAQIAGSWWIPVIESQWLFLERKSLQRSDLGISATRIILNKKRTDAPDGPTRVRKATSG